MVAAWGLTTDWSTKTPGRLYALDLNTKALTPITAALGNLDGLEQDQDGRWIVSDWAAGKVLRVSPQGKIETILSGFKGPADLGYDARRNILYLPRMQENRVSAFDLSRGY